jgi:hypothetical protein
VALATLLAAPAGAQGRGNGFGRNNRTSATAPTPTAAINTASATGIRQFGSWLDDASVVQPGGAWTSISFGYFTSDGSRQTDMPVIDAGVGVARRVQLGISVPYYHLNFPDGTRMNGVGDVYFNTKVVLADPAEQDSRIGIAITPVVEVASQSVPGTSRFAWAAPISFEARRDTYRVFGSTGYFSRGAFFGSGAIEKPLSERAVITGSMTHMRSLKDDVTADAMGIPKARTDITAVMAYFVNSSIAAFVGTGRTLASGGHGTSFMLTGGLSFSFTPGSPMTPRR